ncbi:MAG: hypothetical protein GEV06_05460 [Luteitalea sp.]|nr:hypothetical protein [Luteitalea sp.]
MSIPADERVQTARQVLVDILKENGPQLGAKLKVRLTSALGQRLGLPADAWHGLVPKLSHFLAANSDLVDVLRPAGPGDIRVSLRDAAAGRPHIEVESTKVWYRPDAWTAFVNPDPNRRRFFHRQRHEIVHFSTQSTAPQNPQLADRVARDPQFVEIQFAGAEEQQAWLREFLDTTPLISEAHKRVARHFVDVPFDSSINAAFAASLGPHGDAWRRFRAKKVDDFVIAWAERNAVDLDTLKRFPEPGPLAAHPTVDTMLASPSEPQAAHATAGGDPRSALLKFIASLEDSELRQVLIPLSAVERILRPRS